MIRQQAELPEGVEILRRKKAVCIITHFVVMTILDKKSSLLANM